MNNIKQSVLRRAERFKKTLQDKTYEKISELKITVYKSKEPVPFSERPGLTPETVKVGDSWGELFDCAWFHFEGEVPRIDGEKVLLIDINGEACVVSSNGTPVLGLTNVSSAFDETLGKPGKRVVPLANETTRVDLWADAGCNDLFGGLQGGGRIVEANVSIFRRDLFDLYYDFETLCSLANCVEEDTARFDKIISALDNAILSVISFSTREIARAKAVLAVELARKNGDTPLEVSAIGHAHIDLAWYWPIRETIRKGARTFATAIHNLDAYPDYIFGASQPQLFAWMKEFYPALYGKIKQYAADGRIEPQGAMWVEADTNVSGGEALIRQILYGKRFFREEFGYDTKVLWLPDVFGYTAALPQLLKKSGVDYFMTTKLSWNKYTKHPHHTFIWQGIDGSRVLSHMPPTGTYNDSATPVAVRKAESEYIDKDVSDDCLMLFGIGDGGGGPGTDHLERLKRERNLLGIAPVTQRNSLDFFKRLEKNTGKYAVWQGELYLELHQGTYTSAARNKRFNRKIEYALRELEFAAALNGFILDYAELEKIWKEVLLYQFHDILPGSSIKRVYDESLERYAVLIERIQKLTQQAYGGKGKTCVVNSLSWERNEWIKTDGGGFFVNLPPLSSVELTSAATPSASGLYADSASVENGLLCVKFDADGSVTSVYDKQNNREVLSGKSNIPAVYDDGGNAWDFDIDYDKRVPERFILVSSQPFVDAPKAGVVQIYEYNASTLTQRVELTQNSRRIDFITTVDWNESYKMLRTSFNADIAATEAVCDIQFGYVKRPAHRNALADVAKYEVCAHKYADISQPDYGVALMNDSKYGYKLLGNTLDLNLLRSYSFPDTSRERGIHTFTYSLYPHKGGHIEGGVLRRSYELNIPLNVTQAAPQASLFTVDCKNVIIETVKKSEDGDGITIRLYETDGANANAAVTAGFDCKSAGLTDITEENFSPLVCENNRIKLSFKPFEIHTIKFLRKRG